MLHPPSLPSHIPSSFPSSTVPLTLCQHCCLPCGRHPSLAPSFSLFGSLFLALWLPLSRSLYLACVCALFLSLSPSFPRSSLPLLSQGAATTEDVAGEAAAHRGKEAKEAREGGAAPPGIHSYSCLYTLFIGIKYALDTQESLLAKRSKRRRSSASRYAQLQLPWTRKNPF